MEKNKQVMIIGAGAAGVASWWRLSEKDEKVIVFEKENRIGGLAKTLNYGEFKTDIGPHKFATENEYLFDKINDLLDGHLLELRRSTKFCINKKLFFYPLRLKNAFLTAGFYKSSRIIYDYLREKGGRVFIKKPVSNFYEGSILNFGKTLAEAYVLNYTEKVLGMQCREISLDWARDRIRGLSLKEIIKNMFIYSKNAPNSLRDKFFYPENGMGEIFKKIEERILNRGNCVLNTNSFPVKIMHDGKKITNVAVKIKGEIIREFSPEHVISTIPLTELLRLFEPEVPGCFLDALKALKFRSHIFLFITLDIPSVISDHWMYFPEKKIPFARIMEPKNFSRRMSPENKSSLLIEFFCWENDKIWNAGKEVLLEESLTQLEKLGLIRRGNIIDSFLHKERYAYPVYNLNYQRNLELVNGYLGNFANLTSTGRMGAFKYCNFDEALEMGFAAAEKAMQNRKYVPG